MVKSFINIFGRIFLSVRKLLIVTHRARRVRNTKNNERAICQFAHISSHKVRVIKYSNFGSNMSMQFACLPLGRVRASRYHSVRFLDGR